MPGTPEHRPETIIAFDFGLRRIGVAVGQQITGSATAIGVVANGADGPDWQGIRRIIADWEPARLVVGIPTHQDGTPSDLTARARQFIDGLRRFGKPVEATDENYSSREARQLLAEQRARGLRRRVRRENIDSTAAVLIAERWLSTRRPGNQRENGTDLV